MPEELTPTPISAPDAPPIAPTATAAPAAAPASRPLLDDANLTDAPAEDAPPPSWREDWRDALAGEDEGFGKHLKRFASPENFAKSYRELEKRLKSAAAPAPLPEDATEQEIAAHRKALGIPDKPEGYKLAFPEELQASEADKAGLAAFQEYALAKNLTPAATKAAFEFWTQAKAAADETAREATKNNIRELKAAYPGREFDKHMNIAMDFLAPHFEGQEKALDMVFNATMPNGVKVKSFAPFVKGLVQMGLTYADDDPADAGDSHGGGKSLEDEKDALLDKSATGKLTKAEDARLNQIYEAITAKEARAGRSRVRA